VLSYVSAMGNGPTREAIAAAGWRLLLSPVDRRNPGGLRYGLDNGAWPAFQAWLRARQRRGQSDAAAMAEWQAGAWVEGQLSEDRFEDHLDRLGAGADWVVLPDIVACAESLSVSVRWLNRCLAATPVVLIAVQDGVTPADVEPYVGTRVGVFLGGSTGWKLATAEMWGQWCAERPCVHPLSTPDTPRRGAWFHFARVNTQRRYRLAHAVGADSTDGSSVARFSSTLAPLDAARRQPDLFSPQRTAA